MRTLTMSLAYLALVILLTTATTARQARGDMICIAVYDSHDPDYGGGTTFWTVDLSDVQTFNQYPSYEGCKEIGLHFTPRAWYPECEVYAMDYSQSRHKLVAVLHEETLGYGLAEFDPRDFSGWWVAALPQYIDGHSLPYEDASMSISPHGDNTLLYLPNYSMLYDLAELDYGDPTSLPHTAKGIVHEGSNLDDRLDYQETGLAHHPRDDQMFFFADREGLYYGYLNTVGDPTRIDRAPGSFGVNVIGGNNVDPGLIVAMDFAPSGGLSTPWPYDSLYTVSYLDSYPGIDPDYYLCGWTSTSTGLQMRFVSQIPGGPDARVVGIAITPLPGAVLLGMLGLSAAGVKLRKSA